MSVKLMAWAWETDLPQTEKMVLLCLCDHANDEGLCWPSMARMAIKCSVTDRSVRRAIKSLTKKSVITVSSAPGKTNHFVIDPGHCVTPDRESPRTQSPKPRTQSPRTPDTVSPEPLKNRKNHKTKQAKNSDHLEKPDEVGDQTWTDFLRHRKRNGGDVTPTALKGFQREAEKAGWSLEDALAETVLRGWRGFKADWVVDKKTASSENSYLKHLMSEG